MAYITFYNAWWITLVVILFYLNGLFQYWKARGIKHEPPSLFRGNMKEFRKTKNFVEILDPIYKKYKCPEEPYIGYYMYLRPCVLATTLEFIKTILQSENSIQFEDRGLFHNKRNDPLTANVMYLDGQDHNVMRTKVDSLFYATHRMEFIFECVHDVGLSLIRKCIDLVADPPQNIFNVSDITARYASDIIGHCGFGIESNALRNREDQFYLMGQRALKERWHHGLLEKFIEFVPNYAKTFRYRKFHPEVTKYYEKLVKETRQQRLSYRQERSDFFAMFMHLISTNVLKKDEIPAHAFSFILGGFDTIASTLCFALYELAHNQSIQDRLRREINDQIIATRGNFSYKTILKNMPFLDCILSETLRKYPVHPYIQRICKRQFKFDKKPSHYINYNTICVIPVFSIHRDPAYYEDPDRFIPERFTPEAIKKRKAFTYLPFGHGRRNCIGERFGKLAVSMALIQLVRNFRFTTSARTVPKIEFDPVSMQLVPKEPVYLKMEQLQIQSLQHRN